MRVRWLAAAVLVFSAAGLGCHGPKSDCEGTMESYASIIDGNHWTDYPDIVYPPQRAKLGDANIINWLGNNYFGARSFKFTKLQAQEAAGGTCLASTESVWEQKIRGQRPETISEVFTFTLHQVNGKWYVEVPGVAKINGFVKPDEEE